MIESGDVISTYLFSGTIIYLNGQSARMFDEYSYPIAGRWMENEYEICLSAYVANFLAVSVGDTVILAGLRFALTGIYETADNTDPAYNYDRAYHLSVGDDTPLDRITIQFTSSEEMFNCYRALLRIDPDTYCNTVDSAMNRSYPQHRTTQ